LVLRHGVAHLLRRFDAVIGQDKASLFVEREASGGFENAFFLRVRRQFPRVGHPSPAYHLSQVITVKAKLLQVANLEREIPRIACFGFCKATGL
jgi:hypothetical protein